MDYCRCDRYSTRDLVNIVFDLCSSAEREQHGMEGESEMMTSSSSVNEVGGVDTRTSASARKASEVRRVTAVIKKNFLCQFFNLFYLCLCSRLISLMGASGRGHLDFLEDLREASIMGCMRCWIRGYTNL